MISLFVTNLLIPGDPVTMTLSTLAGPWNLRQLPTFAAHKDAIVGANRPRPQALPIAETYYLENDIDPSLGLARVETAFAETTPLFIAATFATGMSVTSDRSTGASVPLIAQASERWPRARALDAASNVVNSATDFTRLVEAFVSAWPTAGQTEKALLLVHHWLDALSCWSMEDLYLSATTLLQVIVATEATAQGKSNLVFFDGLRDAALRKHIRPLGRDFKDMRNELVHDGRLIGTRFSGPDKQACATVVADVLNWFDEYVHAALSLGPICKTRFRAADFMALNAYSI